MLAPVEMDLSCLKTAGHSVRALYRLATVQIATPSWALAIPGGLQRHTSETACVLEERDSFMCFPVW